MNDERQRLADVRDGRNHWDRFGPYLSERAWATVREDYSPYGDAWESFPHDHTRSRAYRWSEDGIGGISDDRQFMCLALALWNGRDPILKERFFGVTGTEGNHGEDVKEYYFYRDSTPTHSYMKMLYKYPHAAFPYGQLVAENKRRTRQDDEYELIDTGVFDQDRYFDVQIEYAKAGPDDVLMRVSATNRGPDAAQLHLLPTLWFRNTWTWSGHTHTQMVTMAGNRDEALIHAHHSALGDYTLACDSNPDLLFTENETNKQRLYGVPNATPYVKDGINNYIVNRQYNAINEDQIGTKVAAHHTQIIAPGATWTIRLRLTGHSGPDSAPHRPVAAYFADFDAIFSQRIAEADEFFDVHCPVDLQDDMRMVHRQAVAGLLWSKEFYHYNVETWLDGDAAQPPPPPQRKTGRNWSWTHLNNADILSMPDKWEYPWFAAWDLAFHCIPLALVDSHFAKRQLETLVREWYQHPNGAIPAYEWAFGDVNPPVLAWAAWRVYQIERKQEGTGDSAFLETIFHKLLLNFTWWVNRKDSEGRNVFQGGFLGLDNIGVFDRSAPLPTGGYLEQSDGTSWMGMFSLNMLKIALELARTNPVYENIATKFFEHFLAIAKAMNSIGSDDLELWDAEDEFFYDVLHQPDGSHDYLKVRSLVGLIPLLAVETIDPDIITTMPGFRSRLEWYLAHRPDLAELVSRWQDPGAGERRLLALVRGHRLKRILHRMLDPEEFLSDYGIRSLSKYHAQHPYELNVQGTVYRVAYEPAESRSGLFGGNSNWRGPVWFPINYLLIETLQKLHHYYSDDFLVECPTGSGNFTTLNGVADELSRRLIRLFTRDATGHRAVFGGNPRFNTDPHWRDNVPFYEYFHGDTGAGLGASHQTGWTALVAKLIRQQSIKDE